MRARLLCTTLLALSGLGFAASAALAQATPAVADAIEGYFDFVDAHGGTITAEQIPAADYARLYVLDVRDATQFAQAHIPGAHHIEWRRVFAERARLPRDRMILVYCNTSSFAAQVAMALRLDGFENVRVLYGGYQQWKASGGLEANARAAGR